MENENYTSEDKQMLIETYGFYRKFSWVNLGNGGSKQQSRESFDKRTLMAVEYVEKLKEKLEESEKSQTKKWKLVGDWKNLVNLIYSLVGLGALVKILFFNG